MSNQCVYISREIKELIDETGYSLDIVNYLIKSFREVLHQEDFMPTANQIKAYVEHLSFEGTVAQVRYYRKIGNTFTFNSKGDAEKFRDTELAPKFGKGNVFIYRQPTKEEIAPLKHSSEYTEPDKGTWKVVIKAPVLSLKTSETGKMDYQTSINNAYKQRPRNAVQRRMQDAAIKKDLLAYFNSTGIYYKFHRDNVGSKILDYEASKSEFFPFATTKESDVIKLNSNDLMQVATPPTLTDEEVKASGDKVLDAIYQATAGKKLVSLRGLSEDRRKGVKVETFPVNKELKAEDVLATLIDNAGDDYNQKYYATLATLFLPLVQDNGITFNFIHEGKGSTRAGFTKGNQISINVDSGGNVKFDLPKVILHELIHALTVQKALSDATNFKMLENMMVDIIRQLNHYADKFPDSEYKGRIVPFDVYALYNPKEFIAEFFSNREFQTLLMRLKPRPTSKMSWFEKLINWILGLIKSKTSNTLYDQLVPVLTDLVVQPNVETEKERLNLDTRIIDFLSNRVKDRLKGRILHRNNENEIHKYRIERVINNSGADSLLNEDYFDNRYIEYNKHVLVFDRNGIKFIGLDLDENKSREDNLQALKDKIIYTEANHKALFITVEDLKAANKLGISINDFVKDAIEGTIEVVSLNATPKETEDLFTGTDDEIAEKIIKAIDKGDLKLGETLYTNNISKSLRAKLNTLSRYGLYKAAFGNYTVGYTETELRDIKFKKDFLDSKIFTASELKHLAKTTMFKVSDYITMLQSNEASKSILGLDKEFKNADFTHMTRIEVLNTVGLDRLLNIVKETVFNVNVNTEPADNDDDICDKMNMIYDNFEAFIKLGYDTLADMEEVALNEKPIDMQEGADGEVITEETEQETQEIFGNSLEHWQVGFRQLSAHSSLSKILKTAINKLYVINPDGTYNLDEYGIARKVDGATAVNKILLYTQGALSLDEKNADGSYKDNSMIGMLQKHLQAEPWLNQLVGTYWDGGLIGGNQMTGILVNDGNEQFKSQFYSKFKMYFQKYAVIYKDEQGKGIMKIMNDKQFADETVKNLQQKERNKDKGALTIWNAEKGEINEKIMDEIYNLLTSISHYVQYSNQYGLVRNPKTGKQEKRRAFTMEDAKSIQMIYTLLNIDTPTVEELYQIFNPSSAINKGLRRDNLEMFCKYVMYLGRTLASEENKANFKYVSYKTRSYINELLRPIAPYMGSDMESVTYANGKLYYSYVLPNYLSKLFEKLNGTSGNAEDTLNEEFKPYEGIFYNSTEVEDNNRMQAGPKGWLNYILELADRKDMDKELLKHVVLLSDEKVGYTDKTTHQYLNSMLSMWEYGNRQNLYGYFRIPIMSNKPSEEYVKLRHLPINDIVNFLAEKTFYQEINRIKAVNYRNTHGAPTITNFDNNGNKFQWLDFLNNYLNVYELSKNDKNAESLYGREYNIGRIIYKMIHEEALDPNIEFTVKTKNYKTNETVQEAIKGEAAYMARVLPEVIEDEIELKYSHFLHYLEDENIVKNIAYNNDSRNNSVGYREFVKFEPAVIDTNSPLYSETLTSNTNTRQFFFEDYFYTTQLTQLLVTDTAFYKNAEDLQKRLAQYHAPGLKPNVNATYQGKRVSDGKFRTMYLKDSISVSEIISNMEEVKKKILENPKYQNNEVLRDLALSKVDALIDAFKSINWADAQGYTSPTPYRKKMVMFGKWDNEDEAAYQRILKGDFTLKDLNGKWQPLKPFLYSQIEKDGHNPYLPKLKVGVQNKDSEYLLVMADALMRGQGVQSKLTALFDVMEESQGMKIVGNTLQGEANTKGIDTIQFESTVKTGLMGALDINNLSYDEIKELFKKKMYNADGSYNMDNVHELPFEDYSLQQEIPKHFQGEQQQGSQDRALVVADMPDMDEAGNVNKVVIYEEDEYGRRVAKEITVAEAKKNYYNAIKENVETSVQELSERLGVNFQNQKLRNIQLSRILQQEILSSGRGDLDLLWACFTDENGEFNIPLSDPVQTYRIQQLLNSIIKNTVYKQKIAGGPVVQTSSYGLSDNLNIRFQDKDGNILLTEKEFNEALKTGKQDNKYIKIDKENTYDEYKSKHQNSVAYFECYLPIYDENIIKDFAKEDGTIDIKAMEKTNPRLLEMVGYRIPTEAKYSMVPIRIKGFLPVEAGEAIMLPKEITLLSGSDFDIDKLYIMRYSLNRFKVKDKKGFVEWASKETGLSKELVRDIISKDSTEAEKLSTQAELIRDAWKNYQGKRVIYRSPKVGKEANDNLNVATQWAILTSPQAMSQVLSAGNFDELKRVGYMIEAARTSEEDFDELGKMSIEELKDISYSSQSLMYADTQLRFHKQNMVAAKLIGVFAVSNISHAIIMNAPIHKIGIEAEQEFTLNGHDIRGDVSIDEEYSFDGVTRISENLAQLLAASVDAVKDPILNLMGINMNTVNIVTTLVRLGFSLETVGLFLSTPIIQRLANEYAVRASSGDYVNIDEMILDLTAQELEKAKALDSSVTGVVQNVSLKNEDFKEAIKEEDESIDSYIRNMTILELYGKVNKISDAFRNLTHMTSYNSISHALGPTMANTLMMMIKDTKFEDDEHIHTVLKNYLKGLPIVNSFKTESYDLHHMLLDSNLVQGNKSFVDSFMYLYKALGYMNESIATNFMNFFMSYYVNIENPVFNNDYKNRLYYAEQFPVDFNEIKTKNMDNPLIKAISIETQRNGITVLKLDTRGMSRDKIDELKGAWEDLYEKDPKLAFQLVEYNYFRASFGFSPKTFLQLMPDTLKSKLPNYVANLSNNEIDIEKHITKMVVQFMLNNNLGKYYDLSKKALTVQEDKFGNHYFLAPITTFTPTIIRFKAPDGKVYSGYSKWRDKATSIVQIVDSLGGKGNSFEIDPNVYFPKTVWTEINERIAAKKETEEAEKAAQNNNTETTDAENVDTQPSTGKVGENNVPTYSSAYDYVAHMLFFGKEFENYEAMDEIAKIKGLEKGLETYQYNSMAFPMITDELANKIRQIVGNASKAELTMENAKKTIEELKLC